MSGRIIAAIALLLFAAFPVAAALTSPEVALWFKLAWGVLLLVGLIRPASSAPLLLVLVPWLPWAPFASTTIPFGIVHLFVLSQALPMLVRVVLGRSRAELNLTAWAWLLLVLVAVGSCIVHYAAYSLIFESSLAFWKEVAAQAMRYVFELPGPEQESMMVATTTLADGLLAYLVIRETWRGRDVGTLVQALSLGGLSVALFGFLQLQTHIGLSQGWLSNDPLITRVNATYSDPNALAAYFALVIPATVGLAGASAARRRALWGLVSIVMLAALVMTAGRAGLLALMFGLLVFCVGIIVLRLDVMDAWAPVRQYFRRGFKFAAVVVIIAMSATVALGTALDVRHRDQRSYLHTWLYTANLRQPADVIFKGRVVIWRTAASMIEDHPVFGVGAGRVLREFTTYNARIGGFPPGMRLSAHNTFLNVTAELGLVGLLIWLLLLVAIGVQAVRALGATEDAPEAERSRRRWLLLGLSCGLAGYVLTMMTGDRNVLREDVTMLAAVAAAVSLGLPAQTASRRRWWWLGLIGAAAIAATVPPRAASEQRMVKLDRVESGMYGLERSGNVRFRWTGKRAVFYKSSTMRELSLSLRTLAPFAQTVTVRLDNQDIDRFALTDHAWRQVNYVVPPPKGQARYRQIEVIVGPTWWPQTDPRELGVMLEW